MKKITKYIAFALTGLLLASCMGEDYAGARYDEIPYGNNAIDSTNLVTIAQLKSMYSGPINTDYRDGTAYEQVTTDLQIKGVVTSSDEQGNIYNEIAIQDSTGAIILAVAQGGLYGFLPVGTEILVDLKGLYVGNYGLQAEIGVPTTNASLATYVGRMSRATFDQHYKILSKGNTVEPEEFNASTWNMATDGGKLAIVRNVTFNHNRSVDSTYAKAGGGSGSVSWYFNELGSTVQVYNSNYADFADAVVPTGMVDVTGIMKRYNNSWELIIRTLDDVQVVTDPLAGVDGTGTGTETDPYDVTRALSLIAKGRNDSGADVYVTGVISNVREVSTSYGNATYFLSIDGSGTNELEVFRGYYLNGDKFTDETKDALAVGKRVVVLGKLVDYNGTAEITTGSRIISIN